MSLNQRFGRRRWVALVCAAVATWMLTEAPPTVAAATPTLTNLERIEDLRALFNQDRGKARVVLLLSPT
jgi:hypothetical protein